MRACAQIGWDERCQRGWIQVCCHGCMHRPVINVNDPRPSLTAGRQRCRRGPTPISHRSRPKTHACAKIFNVHQKLPSSYRTCHIMKVTVTAVRISFVGARRIVGRSHALTTAAIISAAVGPAAAAAMVVYSSTAVAAAHAAALIATVDTNTFTNGTETQTFWDGTRRSHEIGRRCPAIYLYIYMYAPRIPDGCSRETRKTHRLLTQRQSPLVVK